MPNEQSTSGPILLARHGQTEWNLEGRRQGQLDSPLTAKGVLDAQQIVAQAAAWPVDVIVSSPLKRAYRTACIIGDM